MVYEYVLDFVRFTHFTGFALGIGAGAFADWSVLRKIDKPLTSCDMAVIERIHHMVWLALGLLWVSGLVLVGVRTGFSPDLFTAKIVMKIATVVVLTLNAVAITYFALPVLKQNINSSYLEFSLEEKTLLALMSAVSICSWISALVLGVFAPLRTAGFDLLVPMLIVVYGAGMFASVMVTLYMQILYDRYFPHMRYFGSSHAPPR